MDDDKFNQLRVESSDQIKIHQTEAHIQNGARHKNGDPSKMAANKENISHQDLQGHLTLWLALSTLAVSVGCGSQMGYNGGGISVPAPFIREFLNQTNQVRWNGSASDLILTWIYSVTITMFAFGAALGSMLSGTFSDTYGRKKCMLYSNFLAIFAALCMGLCQVADTYGLLVLGRFLIGVYGGFSFTIMPFYLAEIAPINLRGSVGVFSSLCRATGTLTAHVLGFAFFYSQEKWPAQLALTSCLAIFNLILFPFCPESPRWLFITQNRREEGIQALQKLRGPNADISAEIEEMKTEYVKNMKANTSKTITAMDILKFRRPEWKMALLLGAGVQLAIQLSGFGTVMMYTTDVYKSAGLGMREIAYATVGLSSLNTVMTGISVLIVDKCGRRPLLLVPFLLGIVSLLGITVFINQQENYSFMKWMTVGVIYLYVSTFSLGPVSIKNLIAAEMWLQDARPAAMSLIMQVNWWSTVFVNLTFPVLEGAIGSYTYLFYTFCLLILTIFLFIYLPETKQRTFDEIVQSLLKHKKTTMTMDGNRERAPTQVEVYEMDVTDDRDDCCN